MIKEDKVWVADTIFDLVKKHEKMRSLEPHEAYELYYHIKTILKDADKPLDSRRVF